MDTVTVVSGIRPETHRHKHYRSTGSCTGMLKSDPDLRQRDRRLRCRDHRYGTDQVMQEIVSNT